MCITKFILFLLFWFNKDGELLLELFTENKIVFLLSPRIPVEIQALIIPPFLVNDLDFGSKRK